MLGLTCSSIPTEGLHRCFLTSVRLSSCRKALLPVFPHSNITCEHLDMGSTLTDAPEDTLSARQLILHDRCWESCVSTTDPSHSLPLYASAIRQGWHVTCWHSGPATSKAQEGTKMSGMLTNRGWFSRSTHCSAPLWGPRCSSQWRGKGSCLTVVSLWSRQKDIFTKHVRWGGN